MLPPGASLRAAVAADVPALAALYADAARAAGPACYSPEQVVAWTRFGSDGEVFRRYVLGADTWIAVDVAGQPLGFSGMRSDGEVQSLYVRAGHGRRGLGTLLLAHSLARGRAAGLLKFAAWVTPISRPVFERAGFRLLRTVREPFEGVEFERYRVELDAAARA